MKLIIAGSRSFGKGVADHQQMDYALEKYLRRVTEVVSGGAMGADSAGESWASNYGIWVRRFIPDWKKHGKKAGPIRNAEMADYADEAIVFWDGASRGTKDMIEQMKKRGKPCQVCMIHMKALSN